jgi:hypothetical protein
MLHSNSVYIDDLSRNRINGEMPDKAAAQWGYILLSLVNFNEVEVP